MYQIVILSKLCAHPRTELSLGGLEFWSVRLIKNRVSLFFFKINYWSSIVAMIFLLGTVLEVIEKLRLFLKRSVLIWVNYLEDILITHFLSVILVAFCITLFLLISSLDFRIYLFFVKSKDIYKFSWIFSTRWISSGVIDAILEAYYIWHDW